jgi:hypothetical protein
MGGRICRREDIHFVDCFRAFRTSLI